MWNANLNEAPEEVEILIYNPVYIHESSIPEGVVTATKRGNDWYNAMYCTACNEFHAGLIADEPLYWTEKPAPPVIA